MHKLPVLYLLLILFTLSCRREDPVPAEFVEVPASELLSGTVQIQHNPDAPLTAIARVQTTVATTLEVKVEGDIPFQRSYTDSIVSTHVVPVLGLYAGVENPLIIRIEDPQGRRFALDTSFYRAPALPDFLPDIRIDKANSARMEPGFTLCELNIGGDGELRLVPIIFDHNGDIRWYMDFQNEGWRAPFETLENGNFFYARGWGIFEYDRLGHEANRWGIPGYWQHHDVIEKPDGNFVAPATRQDFNTGLDFIVEVGRDTGGVSREWDLRQVLDVDRFDLIRNPYDWLHVNSVWYDERDQGLIISGRHQGVCKVSQENELQWILAPHQGWGKAGPEGEGFETSDYLLTAVDAAGEPYSQSLQQGLEGHPDFRWPWGQHAAMLLPNGNLLMFDNGWHRHFTYDAADFSRTVEYEIDEEKGTVRQVWQYGEERGAEIYSPNISDVDYLPETGNILFVSGNIAYQGEHYAKVIEVSRPGREVIFEATVLFKNKFSTGTGWAQADIVYRGERVKLW